MRRLRSVAIIAVALGTQPACAGDVAGPVEALYGSWTWVSSCGGLGGGCRTPTSVGYTERLVLERAFLGGGVATMWRDDTLYWRQAFRVRWREDPAGTRLVIEYTRGMSQTVRFDGEDLLLTDSCNDCYEHRYTPSP